MTKKWTVIEGVADVIGFAATIVGLFAGFKNDEDFDERVKRVVYEEKEEDDE